MAFGQNVQLTDSLLRVVETDISDKDKADAYQILASEFSRVDSAKTFLYANKSIGIGEKIGHWDAVMLSRSSKAWVMMVFGHKEEALKMTEELLQFAKEKEHKKGQLIALTVQGAIYTDEGKYQKSVEILKQALVLAKETKDTRREAIIANNLALALLRQDKLTEALEFLHIVINVGEELNWGLLLISGYTNIGLIYYQQEDYQEALDYQQKALEWGIKENWRSNIGGSYLNIGINYDALGENEKALDNYLEALKVAEEIKNPKLIATCFYNVGDVYNELGQLDSASLYLERGIEISQEQQYKLIEAELLNSSARVQLAKTNYRRARQEAKQAIDLATEMNSVSELRDGYLVLSMVEDSIGNHSAALQAYQQYHTYYDSILGEENSKALSRLRVQYETEKKEQEIASLNQQAQIQSLELDRKSQNLLLLAVLLILITVVAGLIYIFNRQKRLSIEHKAQNIEQRLLRTQMNPHFIFNSLSAIQDYVMQGSAGKAGRYLAKFSKLMRQVLENSRNEFVSLQDEVTMLENYMELQNLRRDVPFSYNVVVDDQIDVEEIAIPPMFAQPFVENAIEHGLSNLEEGGQINIRFLMKDERLVLQVSDNGVGIEQTIETKQVNHQSQATKITQERIALFKQMLKKDISFDLQTEKNGGTSVTFNLPFQRI